MENEKVKNKKLKERFEKRKKGVSKFFDEFKKFISRGNIVDLSVAVIIGGAFSAIVTALTNKIIMPLVNWLLALCGGKEGLESAYTILSAGYTDGQLDLTKSIYIDWGAFVAAILNFFIIAMTIFLLVKVINLSRDSFKKMEEEIKKQTRKEVIQEKRAVKLQAKQEGRKYKEVYAELLAKKAEEAKKLEEEKITLKELADKKLAEEKSKMSKEELLLTEIRDLLSKK